MLLCVWPVEEALKSGVVKVSAQAERTAWFTSDRDDEAVPLRLRAHCDVQFKGSGTLVERQVSHCREGQTYQNKTKETSISRVASPQEWIEKTALVRWVM